MNEQEKLQKEQDKFFEQSDKLSTNVLQQIKKLGWSWSQARNFVTQEMPAILMDNEKILLNKKSVAWVLNETMGREKKAKK